MKQSIDILISWFERGDKPLAAHFVSWLNSYWHKDQAIPQSAIEGLSESLGSVPSPELLQALATGSVPTYQDVTELSSYSGVAPNPKLVYVKDVGLFLYEETGTPDGVLYFASSDSGVWKKQSGSGGISEAPTTPNTIFGRSGENESWTEAVPVVLTKDITIDLGDFNLNETKTTTDYTYDEWKLNGNIERRITENATQTKCVEDTAYNYRRVYVSYNDGAKQFDNYRQVEQTRIEDTVTTNDENFTRYKLDETGAELSISQASPSVFHRAKVALAGFFFTKGFIDNTPTENSSPIGKKLLVRDATTGEIQSIDVTNLGLGNPLFKGVFISLVALQTAYPTGSAGDYAYVDIGVGQDIQTYVWDNTDSSWILQAGGGGGGISDAPNDGSPYVRQSFVWVQGITKSVYDAFVSATNSAISTINTKLNKYPSTATTGKFIKGNGTNYLEGDVDWVEVQNKPTTFAPSTHSHSISDVTNLQATLNAKELIIVPYISKPDLVAINPTTERRILVSISANTTLSFSRTLVNGESGVINITNTVALSSTITLPANSVVEGAGGTILVTTGIINSRDRVTWEYDGVNIWWTYGENYN